MSTLHEELAAEAGDLSHIPSDSDAARLRKLGMELVTVDARISQLEQELTDAKARRNAIQMTEMPSLMEEIGQDRIGLPDAYEHGADLELRPYYHANIAKDWEPERQDAAFDYLQSREAGDLVKSAMVISAGRGDLEKMQRLQQRVVQMFAELELEAQLTMDLSVPWNTLTAYVKEQIEGGEVLDLEVLGATVGQTVKIKKRKGK